MGKLIYLMCSFLHMQKINKEGTYSSKKIYICSGAEGQNLHMVPLNNPCVRSVSFLEVYSGFLSQEVSTW